MNNQKEQNKATKNEENNINSFEKTETELINKLEECQKKVKTLEKKYKKKPLERFWELPDNVPKNTISKPELRDLLERNLGDRLRPDTEFYIPDHKYFLPPMENAEEIIGKSQVYDDYYYVAESFDCDDFALIMKSHFIEAGYKNWERRPPFCFGIAWGQLGENPGAHAINWMFVRDDSEIWFIEPQTGKHYRPRYSDRDIFFILA